LSYKTLNIRILQTKLQIIHDKTALQSNFATIPTRLAKLLHSMGRRGFFQSTPTRIRTILCWIKHIALIMKNSASLHQAHCSTMIMQ